MDKKILVFDTETTGLPPFQIFEDKYPPSQTEDGKWELWKDYDTRMKTLQDKSRTDKKELEENPSLWESYTESWPYIVQLSYILFDTNTKETIVRDVYVNLPPSFTTEQYLTSPDTHPITKAAIEAGLQAERKMITEAINEFMEYFRMADVVTGHNVDFDVNMLLAECKRTSNESIFRELLESKANKIYCTGCKSTNLLKIYYDYNRGKQIYKMPQLKQAYFRMFGYAPVETALHNALIDVVACLRVFYRLWFQGIGFEQTPMPTDTIPVCGVGDPDIYKVLSSTPENPIIQIINSFTPPDIDPNGVGSPLESCPPIENDLLTSIIEKKSIEVIKSENKEKSRPGRYKKITGIDPFKKGGSYKFTKRRKTKSKRRKTKIKRRKSKSKRRY